MSRVGVGHRVGQGHRADGEQRPVEALGVAQHRQRLGVAQVGVHVHDADLPAEEAGRFAALKMRHGPAAVNRRPIHEPRAVGGQQVLLDEREVRRRFIGREQLAQHAADHGQQAVGHAGGGVRGVQEVIRAVALQEATYIKACGHAVFHDVLLEVVAHAVGLRAQLCRALGFAVMCQRAGQAAQSHVIQPGGPAAGHAVG